MGWKSILFWLLLFAFALGLSAALMRFIPSELGSRMAGSLLLVSALLIGLTSWRENGFRSREGRRAAAYVVGITAFGLSAFVEPGLLKSVLLGITIILVFGVLFDRWRSRRAAA